MVPRPSSRLPMSRRLLLLLRVWRALPKTMTTTMTTMMSRWKLSRSFFLWTFLTRARTQFVSLFLSFAFAVFAAPRVGTVWPCGCVLTEPRNKEDALSLLCNRNKSTTHARQTVIVFAPFFRAFFTWSLNLKSIQNHEREDQPNPES